MFRNPLIDAAVVLIALLLIFGPKRLPLLGRSLGQGMREFKDSISGLAGSSEEDERPLLTQSTAAPASPSAAHEPVAAEPGANEPRS